LVIDGVCSDTATHIGSHDAEDIVVEVTVSGYVTPIIPARRSGHPDNWSPAEGGECENLTTTVNGQHFDLTPNEEQEAIDALRRESERVRRNNREAALAERWLNYE
jgi:hypothetical protein